MSGPHRLAAGGAIDRSRRIAFTFDGQAYVGHPGDTLASALLANGVRIVGRSFKYHRPRGILSAGPEEPSALVTIRAGGRREANVPATMVELFDGLVAASQNRWPSLGFDFGAVNGLLAPLLPAGFYYKTFKWPPAAWERLYEPLIRRAAGLGRIADEPDPDRSETVHAHCDVLVVGAGRAGRDTAREAAAAGWRVILAEQDFAPLPDLGPEVRVLPRTTVFGLYDHGVAGAVERVADHLPEPRPNGVRQRQWVIRAEEIVLATGTVEQIACFAGNDRPGVMQLSAARRYAERFGVACGTRAVVVLDSDKAASMAESLGTMGIAVAAAIDLRRGERVLQAVGAPVRAVRVLRSGRQERIACDLVLMSGGLAPQTQLFRMACGNPRVRLVGRAAIATAPWHVDPTTDGKAFVDLQNDVTVADIRLAHREGYRHVEHMKRYTTHGMGTDQGKTGGLLGSAVLAGLEGGSVAAVGLPTARPYASPVAWGVLAGAETGPHFRPERRLPLHDWHAANGAQFVKLGLWLRPLVYSREPGWGPVLAEARAVRNTVGISDVTSLGKIDVQGRDALTFLDRIYANALTSLKVGRARYGLMLREDGIVFDDGTVARLGEEHFLLSTTTANAAAVLEHLEFHHETCWPDLDVRLTNVADQWAQFAIAGPMARAVLAPLVDQNLSDAAFPFMAAGETRIAGTAGRLFRISFSGEFAYEVAVPAHHGLAVWQALLSAGAPFGIRPYGLDALNLLRIEKGHVAGSELNGQTTAGDLGLSRMLKKEGDHIGRVLARRPGLVDPARLGLVGVRVLGDAPLKAGAHLVATPSSRDSQGYVTAACPSTETGGFIGLALLSGGTSHFGERLHATDPVRGSHCDVEIVSPHFVDPANERVRGGGTTSTSYSSPQGGEKSSSVPRDQVRREGGATPGPSLPLVGRDTGWGSGLIAASLDRDIVELVGPGSEEGWQIAPGRALLVGPRRPPGVSAADAAKVHPGAAIVDQSGAFALIRLVGPPVLWVLAKLCRLDLDPRSFGQHQVARTIIAQIPVIVYCVGPGASFDLLVPTTFAHAFRHALSVAAADVGISFEDAAR